jgi:hypothetical protein
MHIFASITGCSWLNYVMECFNFGLKFGEWVYMLFKNGKTCIKTNGFISKFFEHNLTTPIPFYQMLLADQQK